MEQFKTIFSSFTLLACLLISSQAQAKPGFEVSPATYHVGGVASGINMISCSTCHVGTPDEDNVSTSFGVAFEDYSDDDNGGTNLIAYNLLAPYDSDGDGFSNQQEGYAGSGINSVSSTPGLSLPDLTTTGISAKASVGGPVSILSLQTGAPVSALGGTVTFESPASLGTTTTDFMFKAGGAQTGAAVTFYDANGTPVTTNTADGAGGQNVYTFGTNGSVNVIVKDEGVHDLYTTALLQAAAITAYNTSALPLASTLSLNPYATVDAYAKISPLATIGNYAVIDAYALVDAYAGVGVYSQVGSYAYLAPQVDVYSGTINTYAQISPYAQVAANITSPGLIAGPSGAGHVAAKFSVTSTAPIKLIRGIVETSGGTGGGGSTGGGTDSGGLHCMTSGLGTQGLIFFGLLAAGFFARRKKR